MERKVDNFNNFIDTCETYIADFFSLQQDENIKKKGDFFKECLFEFFTCYRKQLKKGEMIQFNHDFINRYLSDELIRIHPDFSKRKIIEIQTLIKKYLNYLFLRKIVKKENYRTIINNLYNKTILKKKIDDYSKLRNNIISDNDSNQIISCNDLSLFFKSCLTFKSSIKTSFEIILNEMGISKKEYHEYLKNKHSKYNTLYTFQEKLIKKFTKEIRSPLYYFPDKKDHLLKNWFCYEFTTSLIGMLEDYFFIDNLLNTSDIILLEKYVKFCFSLSVKIMRIITNELTSSLFLEEFYLKELEDLLEEDLFFQENKSEISTTEIINTIYCGLTEMLCFCQNCPNHCLNLPRVKCTMFEDPFYALDLVEDFNSNRLVNKKNINLLEINYSQQEILGKTKKIYFSILNNSKNVTEGNFTKISEEDLKFLFKQYNREFFSGMLKDLLKKEEENKLIFQFSSRMTKSGGSTTKIIKKGHVIYKISISSYLLFNSFLDIKRTIKINGIKCKDRIEALQRIFEHELIHLVELLVRGDSSCSTDRFKNLAKQIFLHTDNKHQLITQEERAFIKFGIKVGNKVGFKYDNKSYIGIVDRITKRATVLVKNNEDTIYSTKEGIMKFYIPLSLLNKEE